MENEHRHDGSNSERRVKERRATGKERDQDFRYLTKLMFETASSSPWHADSNQFFRLQRAFSLVLPSSTTLNASVGDPSISLVMLLSSFFYLLTPQEFISSALSLLAHVLMH